MTDKENVIEFMLDEKTATVTFTQRRYITRIKELAKKKPDECKITHINRDGSIVAHIPVSWIRINPTMELSEERKKELADSARKMTTQRIQNNEEGFMSEPEYPFYED